MTGRRGNKEGSIYQRSDIGQQIGQQYSRMKLEYGELAEWKIARILDVSL